jgi:hypothetical protein
MKALTPKDAKYGFGRLVALVRPEAVGVANHGRPVVVVLAVVEFEWVNWSIDLEDCAFPAKEDP